MPKQCLQLTLIGPLRRANRHSRTHRIFTNIGPLRVIAIALTQLSVPVVSLPDLALDEPSLMQFPRDGTFPVRDPLAERKRGVHRRTEQMDVVWHDHITTDGPCIRRTPGVQQDRECVGVGQQATAILRAGGQKNQQAAVTEGEPWQMRGTVSNGQLCSWQHGGRRGRRPSRRSAAHKRRALFF